MLFLATGDVEQSSLEYQFTHPVCAYAGAFLMTVIADAVVRIPRAPLCCCPQPPQPHTPCALRLTGLKILTAPERASANP